MTAHSFHPETRGPLHSVRVLDLTRLVSGGHFGVVLGDLGAEVIKVEVPQTGDLLREARIRGVAAYWKVYGRNKKSITLNLKHDKGREILFRLAESAQILAENYIPGKLEELGLSPQKLWERNPKLIITRISGWGQTGPYANRPGFGTLAEAAAGFIGLNGYADLPPLPSPLALADMVAGLYAAAATTAAVCFVQKGGAGQVVDLSLYEPLLSMMGPDALLDKLGEPRSLGEGTKASSVKGVFKTRDGKWVAMSAATPEAGLRFFKAIGKPEVLRDPRFSSYTSRLANRDALNAIIAEFYGQFTLQEAMQFIVKNELTASPVYSVAEAMQDRHFQERETFVTVPDREGEVDGIPMHNVVPRLSCSPGAIRLPAPKLGEHNDEIYGELGFDGNDLKQLEAEGVI